MYKYSLALCAVFALLVTTGAGCNESTPAATDKPVTQTPPAATEPVKTVVPTPTPTPTPDTSLTAGLQPLPYTEPTQPLEDDSKWSHFTTKSNMYITYPSKGAYAPRWELSILPKGDEHVKDGCYVTDKTVYKLPKVFATYENGGCLTTTAFDVEAGTRTDYALVGDTTLFTFTKAYPAKFDHNMYTATLIKIVNIVD